MVTNVVTIPGESFLDISGNTLHVKPRVQGDKVCRDGYLSVMITSGVEDGTYIPPQSGTIYIRNAEQARLIAQAFTELADVMKQ